MSSNFGKVFTLTSFGESHGFGIGGIIDGCPAGITMDFDFIQNELDKRKPGSELAKNAGTNRQEADQVKFLSGIFEGKTTGTPIAFIIENTNQKSKDYGELAKQFRPGHADIAYQAKYGRRDPRGGGRSSGRETAARVAGGAIAQLFLKSLGVEIYACTLAIDGIEANNFASVDIKNAEKNLYYAANAEVVEHWNKRIDSVRQEKDSVGGVVRIVVQNPPCGLGEPVFNKLDAALAGALMGVGTVKAVEVGDGVLCAQSRGSQNNDSIRIQDGKVCFQSNHAGGILGGISTGQDIILTVAAKPIASIGAEQESINSDGEEISLSVGGRHDICVIPRIVPVLTAMTALTLADMVLLQRRMNNESSFFYSVFNDKESF